MAEKKHVIEYTDIIKAFETVKEKLKNKSNKGHQHLKLNPVLLT